MQASILDAYQGEDLKVFIVWIKMNTYESLRDAKEASTFFTEDPRIAQFYDSSGLLGHQIAQVLGGRQGDVAWDVYLFFGKGDMWRENIPIPLDWMHQLQDSDWADTSRLYVNKNLYRKLEDITSSLFIGDLSK